MYFSKVKQIMTDLPKVFSNSITKKLVLVFSLVVSFCIIMIIYISYSQTTEVLKNDFIFNNKNVLKFVNKNFETYQNQIDDLSLVLRKDERFMSILMSQEDDFVSRSYVQDAVKNLFYNRDDIEALQFYIPSDKLLLSLSHTTPNIKVEMNEAVTGTNWYKNASKGRYFRDIEPGTETGSIGNASNVFFTFHRALINISDAKVLGVISISLNFKGIDKLVKDVLDREGELIGIFDQQNRPYYTSSRKLLELKGRTDFLHRIDQNADNGDFIVKDKGTEYLVIYNVSENYKWKMVKLIPLSLVNKKAQQTRDLSFFIGIICVASLIIIIVIISSAITRSLRRLTKQMDKVGSGNFEVKVDVRGNDEIARLSRKFNSMVVQINELINEEYKAKLSEKNARVKALEAQINPHFLYNSLQAISTKAVMSGMKDISKMIEALAYSLRYCFKGGDMVKISSEIDHIKNYLILHKARFEDRLSVEIILEEGNDHVLIPKLSIHTIVENSIKHALEQMTGSMLIRIKTYSQDDRLVVEVADNGPGMTPERLEEVLHDLNNTHWMENENDSIGLKNLNTRLKLMFGDDAQLLLKSGSEGTEVKLVLPVAKQGGSEIV